MDFKWPQYDHAPLGDGRTFSATFESFNERTEQAYYVVTITGQAPFKIVVSLGLIPESEWEQPNFPSRLLAFIVPLVQAGKSNIVVQETVW